MINKNLKKIVFVLLLISGIVSLNSCDKNDLEKIKVAEVAHSVFYAPQYVAISNGFFEEEGLEIEMTTGQGAETPLPR